MQLASRGGEAPDVLDVSFGELEVGQAVKVRATSVDAERGHLAVSMLSQRSEVEIGQKYTGIVSSLRDFGAFVDIGNELLGLLHISNVAEERINDIRAYLKVGQEIQVWVSKVREDGKFDLTMKEMKLLRKLEVGQKLTGTVRSIRDIGAYVDVGAASDGLLGIGRVAEERIDDIRDYLEVGQEVQVWVSNVDRDGRFELTMIESKLPGKLEVGQKLTGTVRSVRDFGAYVDVGARRDGLLHISAVAKELIEDIHDYLKVGQEVQVWVKEVQDGGKIELTMIESKLTGKLEVGQKLMGTVRSIHDSGAHVDVGARRNGLLHISAVAKELIEDIHDYLKVGQEVQVWVQEVQDGGKINLTMIESKLTGKLEVGQKLMGTVRSIHDSGAHVDVGARRNGFLHISAVAEELIDDIHDYLKVGQEVQVWVTDVRDDGKFKLTMIESSPHGALEVGQKLAGTVRSVRDFGAFVDVGARRDGLLHISAVAKELIEDIHDYLKVRQEVQVWVTDVRDNGKFNLTMIESKLPGKLEVGQKLTGTVRSIHDYGAYVDVGARRSGLLHISGVAAERIDDIHDYLKVGQEVQVWIKTVRGDGNFEVTMREGESESNAGDVLAFAGVSPDLWLDATVVRLTPSGAVVSVSPPGGDAAQESFVKAWYVKGGRLEGMGEEDGQSVEDAEAPEME